MIYDNFIKFIENNNLQIKFNVKPSIVFKDFISSNKFSPSELRELAEKLNDFNILKLEENFNYNQIYYNIFVNKYDTVYCDTKIVQQAEPYKIDEFRIKPIIIDITDEMTLDKSKYNCKFYKIFFAVVIPLKSDDIIIERKGI